MWYYEVLIVTSGIMQIGWATKDSKFLNYVSCLLKFNVIYQILFVSKFISNFLLCVSHLFYFDNIPLNSSAVI